MMYFCVLQFFLHICVLLFPMMQYTFMLKKIAFQCFLCRRMCLSADECGQRTFCGQTNTCKFSIKKVFLLFSFCYPDFLSGFLGGEGKKLSIYKKTYSMRGDGMVRLHLSVTRMMQKFQFIQTNERHL